MIAASPSVAIWCSPGEPWSGATYADALCDLLGSDLDVIVRPLREITPDHIARHAGHVLTGGQFSIRDSAMWSRTTLRALRQLMSDGSRGERVVIGICFGAQALAESMMEGVVVPNRLRVGLDHIGFVDGTRAAVGCFNYEGITPELAADEHVEIVATSSGELIEGFRIGEAAWGFQCHLDFDPEQMLALIDHQQDLIREFGLDPVETARTVRAAASEWSPEAFHQWVLTPLRAVAG